MATRTLHRITKLLHQVQERQAVRVLQKHQISSCIQKSSIVPTNYEFKLQKRFIQALIQENIVHSPFPDGIIPEKTVSQLVLEACAKKPGETAILCAHTGRSYTFSQVASLSKKFALGLQNKGFKAGDKLCIYSPNVPEFLIALTGTSLIGGVLTTCNPLYTAHELRKQLTETKAKFLLCHPFTLDVGVEAAKDEDYVQEVMCLSSKEGFTSLEDILKSELNISKLQIYENTNIREDAALILFSSGTTGVPKGTLLTHRNIVANLHQINGNGLVRNKAGDISIAILPFFHSYGLGVVLLNSLFNQTKLVCLSKFTPKEFLEALSKYKVTTLHLVPYITSFLAKDPQVLDYDLSSISLVVSGAAANDGSDWIIESLNKRLPNAMLTQGFGMTELSPVSHYHSEEPIHWKSVGFPVPQTKAKIVDPSNGELQGPDSKGELMVRGPQVMKGYLNNEEATKQTITEDGWLHTGDIAYYDEQGKFFILDRIKELIKYKGLQVSPTELEVTLCEHPAVKDAGVAGLSDESAGELAAALVVLRTDFVGKVSEQDIFDYMGTKLSPHKQLHGGLKFVDEIPRNPTGKISRPGIKEAFNN